MPTCMDNASVSTFFINFWMLDRFGGTNYKGCIELSYEKATNKRNRKDDF